MSKEIENKFINTIKNKHLSGIKVRQAFKSPFKSRSSLPDDNGNQHKESSVISPQEINNAYEPIELPVTANCSSNEDAITINHAHPIHYKVNTTPENSAKSKFRSPFRCPVQKVPLEERSDKFMQDQIDSLIVHEKVLDQQILDLENRGFKVEEAQIYIDKLHKYNEIKDIAQMVLGRLAEIDGVSIREIHKKYDAPLSD